MCQPELQYFYLNNNQSLYSWHINNEGLRQLKYRYARERGMVVLYEAIEN